ADCAARVGASANPATAVVRRKTLRRVIVVSACVARMERRRRAIRGRTRIPLRSMRATGYPRVLQIVQPAPRPRLTAQIDSLLDAYERSSGDPDPTWHAGRGRATRPR